MKSLIATIVLTILFFPTFSQTINKQVELIWKYESFLKDTISQPITLISFDGAVLDERNHFLPYFNTTIELKEPSNVKASLINTEYKPLPEEYYKDLIIPNNIVINHKLVFHKQKPLISIDLLPIRYNDSLKQYERLTKFEIQIDILDPIKPILKKNSSVNSSVLAMGNWYKIAIPSSGIYKLDYELLEELGINPSQINPKNIAIYGNGGGMLPQPNSIEREDDLVENHIYVEGENDGTFDKGDYIQFYAKGPHVWNYDYNKSRFIHEYNYYSDMSYYFITVGTDKGKRVPNQNSIAQNADYETNSYNCYNFHEKNMRTDVTDYTKSGRDWFGETFYLETSQKFKFNIPNLRNQDSIFVESYVAGRSDIGRSSQFFTIETNGQSYTQPIDKTNTGNYLATYCAINIDNFWFKPSSEEFELKFTYSKPNSTSTGWLNYIEINGMCNLKLKTNQMLFRNAQTEGKGIVQYNLQSNFTDYFIWEVTDHLNVKNQLYNRTGNLYYFRTKSDTIKEFIAFPKGKGKTPVAIGKIENQNLHSYQNFDMVIVSYKEYLDEAERLLEFHKEYDSLRTIIVTPNQIYNEFSSGAQDITAIRDFLKMLYDKAEDPKDKPKYLLLFGDASYDYKDILPGNTNFVPTFQSLNIFQTTQVYATDDYYGFLDDNEGDFDDHRKSQYDYIDLAIGRIPVHTKLQAKQMVDKIISYASEKSFGDWRNKVLFVADDADDNGFNDHVNQSERLYKVINENYKDLEFIKLYMDAYQQESTANGAKYPSANLELNNRVNSGVLITNYIGHGGEAGWAHERILEVPDIKSWKNSPNLSLFVTATCEFSRYDDPDRVSAGEWVLLNPHGGSIAMLTTSRVVYVSSNNDLTNKLYKDNIFEFENNKPKTFGEINKLTKNRATFHTNTRKFLLLGDPALRLAYPTYNVVTTSKPDSVKALSVAQIEGYVSDNSGDVIEDFNGKIDITIFDIETNRQTLQNDPLSPLVKFKTQSSVIFKGKTKVKNGYFDIEFFVPKDISYLNENGKISYYASNSKHDANGFNKEILIGGSNDLIINDTSGPIVKLFIGDTNFISGGITNENPLLIARLKDDNGINISRKGIGHELLATLDAETDIILNDYYSSSLNSYKEGLINYQLYNLSEGKHKIKLKVWDALNNSAEGEIEFEVISSNKVEIVNLFNFPNPVSNSTTFSFEHNQSGQDLDVELVIYDVHGKNIANLTNYFFADGNRQVNLNWNLSNKSGAKVQSGIYFYRLTVTNQEGATKSLSSKLNIVR